MTILALDPGGTSGLVLGSPLLLAELSAKDHHLDLWHILCQYAPTMIVCESFTQQRRAADLKPIEYIGVVRLWCATRYVPLVLQSAGVGKTFWTNDKLKTLGYYKAGMPHAIDALRHWLWYVTVKTGDELYLKMLDKLEIP